jgi:hypothetical protein
VEFVTRSQDIIAFLMRKWTKELDYRLIKELWTFGGNRIAVRFAYEWHDDSWRNGMAVSRPITCLEQSKRPAQDSRRVKPRAGVWEEPTAAIGKAPESHQPGE